MNILSLSIYLELLKFLPIMFVVFSVEVLHVFYKIYSEIFYVLI